MLFGLGVDGVVLLYVAYRSGARGRRRPRRRRCRARRTVDQHAARHVDDGGDVLWPDVRRLPEPAAARPADRPQHGRSAALLTLFLVPALLPRRRRRHAAIAAHAAAGSVDRPPASCRSSARPSLVTLVLGIAARGCASTRRSSACARSPRRRSSKRASRRASDCRRTSTSSWRRDRSSSRCSRANEQLTARVQSGTSGRSPSSHRRCCCPRRRRRQRRGRQIAHGRPVAGCGAYLARGRADRQRIHAGVVRAVRRPSAAVARPGAAPDLRRLPQPRSRRPARTIHRPRPAIEWLLATYAFPASAEEATALRRIVEQVDPAQTLTGLDLVNRELARRFLPQFVKGLGIGTLLVIALVGAAFRDWRLSLFALLPTAIGLIWTAGLPGARRRRARSVRDLRGGHLPRHRRGLRHAPRASLSGAEAMRCRRRRSSRR